MRYLPMARRARRSLPGRRSLALLAPALALLVACGQPSAPAGGAAAPKPAAPAGQAAPAQPPPAAELVPARVGVAGVSGAALVTWATYEGGYFAKYGLKVDDVQSIQASTTAIQALIANELDFVAIAPTAYIEADLAADNTELLMIANNSPTIGFFVYVRPEINRVEDLRGKVLGTNRPGTSTYFAASYWLRDQGLTPERDVQLLTTGAVPATVAALEQNQVQAGIVSPPNTVKARQLGLKELADLGYIPYNANGPVTRRALLRENRDVVRRFLQAMLEATARVREDKAFAKQVLAKWTETSEDDVLEETYRVYRPHEVPWVTREGMVPVFEELAERRPAAATVNPEAYYDNSILKELEHAGFIARLYRK